MNFLDITRQAFLFLHLMVFAIAIAEILREDWRLFRSELVDVAKLKTTSRMIKYLLIGLWVSGIALVWFRTGSELNTLLSDPKFHAKILVVGTLTINGVLLHLIAFPLLRRNHHTWPGSAMLVSVLGAISTTSWIFAGFVGASRIVAPHMSFSMFMGFYEFALAAGLMIALIFVQPKVRLLLSNAGEREVSADIDPPETENEARLRLLQQIETAASALGQAHNQLQAVRATVISSAGHSTSQEPIRNDCRQTGTTTETDQPEQGKVLSRAVTG